MAYERPFSITWNHGNNAFSYDKRVNKKLFVPNLKQISSFDEVEFSDEVCFEEYDENNTLISGKWLKHIYEFSYEWIPSYLFDNHNHAYYFWYLARKKWVITDGNILLHIDQHSDMREPQNVLYKPESEDMEKVVEYTNYVLNVGNYIIPAVKEWLIKEVIQIRDKESLEKEYSYDILNLDLDFFAPELDYISYELKKEFILKHISKAKFITVATSPFFIDQKLAIKVFRDIFKGNK